MCWNEHVSLNTFLFGIFVLVIVFINNRFSNYKIKEFLNPYTYLFMMSFITMQFFEFILWGNINNVFINKIVSILGYLLLILQPIASLTMLNNIQLRNQLITVYSIPAFAYFTYKVLNEKFYTSISNKGHLVWNWGKNNDFVFGYIFYLFFLYYSLFVNKNYMGMFYTLLLFAYFFYYYRDGSAGSLWCWSVNFVLFYYLFAVLIYIPYKQFVSNPPNY
jgi:hypothetical protein